MEDVTASVSGIMLLASFAVTEIMPPSRKITVASVLLLLAAGVTMWARVYLPVSRLTADVLSVMGAAGWLAFLACAAPKWVRDIKASARE